MMRRRKHKINKIMAYFYMPLFFAILGYAIVAVTLSPVINTVIAAGSLIISSAGQNTDEVKSYYEGEITVKQPKEGEKIPVEEIDFPYSGTKFGELSCDRIGLSAPVYNGDSEAILINGAGKYLGSFFPCFGSTILIAGHDNLYFAELEKIQKDDIITFKTFYGIYQYKVTDIQVVEEGEQREASHLDGEKEELVLYTCYPFYPTVYEKTQRYFVYADKISGPDIEWEETK